MNFLKVKCRNTCIWNFWYLELLLYQNSTFSCSRTCPLCSDCCTCRFDSYKVLICRIKLKDFFDASVLHDTIIHILETLMCMGSPYHWVGYLMPEDVGAYTLVASSSSSGSNLSQATKFELLIGETRAVILRYYYYFSVFCIWSSTLRPLFTDLVLTEFELPIRSWIKEIYYTNTCQDLDYLCRQISSCLYIILYKSEMQANGGIIGLSKK